MDARSSVGGISIVVPTYNSSRLLSRLLESLESARPPEGEVEVLIIDDSAPHEAAATQALCEEHGSRYLWCKGNVSRKRNLGVANASQPVVLFTDSDCELSPGVLSKHMDLTKAGPEIGAMLGLVEFTGPANWVWSIVERTGFLGASSFARRMPFAPWGVTANLSVKRAIFTEVGGFDETFLKVPGGEDVDLGLRINKAGYKIVCCPDAIVLHSRETWSTPRSMLRRAFGYGRAHYHVIVKHLDKVGREYPRLAAVFLLVWLVLLLKSALTVRWLPLAGGAIFPLVVMLTQAILVLRAEKQGLKGVPREMLAHGLDLTFEAGLLYESLRCRDMRGFLRKIIYAERQLLTERPRKVVQVWSLLAGFLVVLLLS